MVRREIQNGKGKQLGSARVGDTRLRGAGSLTRLRPARPPCSRALGKAAAFGLTGSKTRRQLMVAAARVAEVIFRPVPKVTWTNRVAD